MSRMNCLKKRKGMPLYFNHQPPPQQIYYWSISNVRKKIKRRGEKPDIGDEPVSKKQKMTEMKIEPKTWQRTLSNESLSEIVSLSGSANTNWNKLKHYVKHILWVWGILYLLKWQTMFEVWYISTFFSVLYRLLLMLKEVNVAKANGNFEIRFFWQILQTNRNVRDFT